MYRLYGKPYTMSMVPEAAMDEIGVEYELINLPDGISTDPDYLKLRADGLVPTLEDGDHIIIEGSAIAMHLADKYPDAGLAPPLGSRARTDWYEWMLYLNSMVHPTVANGFHPDWYTDEESGIEGVQRSAFKRADDQWSQIDKRIAGNTWLCGETYTTADILFLTEAYMHYDYPAMFAREKNVAALVGRIQARPKIAAMLKRHAIETVDLS